MVKQIKTLDDVRDLSLNIVDNFVKEGLVKSCIDTDDDTEFQFQDIITEALCNKFGITND